MKSQTQGPAHSSTEQGLALLGESSGGELGLRDAADERCPPFLVLLAIRKF